MLILCLYTCTSDSFSFSTAGVSKEEMEMAEKMAGAINKAGFASGS